ncbi:MAG: YcbK family protein [Deltaproteobacteria bacterium]|nr:YcbK family protein [Deltaproteobacteria bacterium]
MLIFMLMYQIMISAPPYGDTGSHHSKRKTHLNKKLKQRSEKITVLYNLHTREIIPLENPDKQSVFRFFRCRKTDIYPTFIDNQLLIELGKLVKMFPTQRINVFSGFRSGRYNEELRKKLHEVARNSYHLKGKAVDFNFEGVDIRKIASYLRRKWKGGVGFYSKSIFVHMDTGPKRRWRGL